MIRGPVIKTDPESGLMLYECAIGLIDGIDDEDHRCLLLSLREEGASRLWAVLRLANIDMVPANRITMVRTAP